MVVGDSKGSPSVTTANTGKFFRRITAASFLMLLPACSQAPAPPPKTTPSSVASPPVNSATSRPVTPIAAASTPDTSSKRFFRYRNATTDWKLDFTRFDDIQGQNLIMEGPGGGLAIFDYDLDGILDVLYCQGSRLPRTKITNEFTNELYRNTNGLQKVTAPAGLTSHGYHTGAAVGDVDEDGFPDLYIGAYGRSTLWHNNGDGTFVEIGQKATAAVDTWTSSPLLADLNGDGFLDMYLVTYVQAEDDPPRLCKEPRSPTGTLQCSPTLFPALDDYLLVNDGQGGFVDVTREAGITGKDGKGLAAVACDLNGDGSLEIFVANDGTPQFLYVRNGSVTGPGGIVIPQFEERAAELGVAVGGDGRTISGMAAAHGDFDRDGWFDLFVTNFYLEPNILFRNLAGAGFIDFSTASRVGPTSRLTLAFGAEFLDVDNDGWLDLMVANGHIEDRSWSGQEPFRMHPLLYRNDRNSRFTDVAEHAGSYFTSKWLGRGLAFGDLDRDGDIDICISHREDPAALLLNETPPHNSSIVIKPIGSGNSPRSAIGTRAVAKGVAPTLMRDIVGGGSFQSASALELHFGLGDLKQLDQIECTWPDGQVELWPNVKPGYYIAVQGRGLVAISLATAGSE